MLKVSRGGWGLYIFFLACSTEYISQKRVLVPLILNHKDSSLRSLILPSISLVPPSIIQKTIVCLAEYKAPRLTFSFPLFNVIGIDMVEGEVGRRKKEKTHGTATFELGCL